MSFVGRAIGKLTGASDQAKAAERASATQAAAAQAGIGEVNQQLEALLKLFEPYITGGTGAYQAQQDLVGLGGDGAQQAAIDALRQGPQFQAMEDVGQTAILQNASATGGLRGGNTQAALATLSPQILAQLIEQQYSNLGGIAGAGLTAAGASGNARLSTGQSIADLLTQQGAARAGGQLAKGSVARTGFGDLLQIGGMFIGAGKGFGAKPGGF